MKKVEKNNIMRNIFRGLMIGIVALLLINQSFAEEYKFDKSQGTNLKQTTAGCAPAAGFEWLDINNVRARVNTGGDMWWDLPGGVGSKYFIPKEGSATSMFSGSLWIGGLDINNQLKLAALRYRQVGIDYWTGPLTIDGTAAIDEEVCSEYDKHFRMTREMVDEFIAQFDPETGAYTPYDGYVVPQEIQEWPAHGDVNKGQSFYLAPFYDVGGDGEYNWEEGDYPYYDISNELCHTKIPTKEEEIEGSLIPGSSILADQVIKGDQTLWWVFNDKGNIHTETSGAAIGMEIRAQAFAFATNDVINNMTFYSYEIINRSTFELTNTYMSPWVDTDLGYAWDDFVGCDVSRGLGYCYNGAAVDGNNEPESYGDQPPAIGVDFFQGPYMDPDGFDNPSFDGDSTAGPSFGGSCDIVSKDGTEQTMSYYDENGALVSDEFLVEAAAINGVNFGNNIVDDERFGMRRFVYHNNSGGNQGDPSIAPEYYNYLRGIWKNGQTMQYGGDAYSLGVVGPDCEFMFPGDSDPCNWGTAGIPPNGGYTQNGLYWTEETGNNGSPNAPGDRRFMQSAGPFTLKSGAVNYITVGIPWARATSGGPFASVQLLRVVDDKCQALFDNCFKVIDGPDAPDLAIRELDQKLIVYISNSPNSNNYNESYAEVDPNIIQPLPGGNGQPSDSLYKFEGYQIFQLKSPQVSVESLYDADQARLVAQFDVKNGVTRIINYNYNEAIGANVPQEMVDGGDNGIAHSFILTQDAFAENNVSLVNHKQYYYMAVAYGYNNYLPYQPDNPPYGHLGQTLPYLSGRKNIKTYVGVPHKVVNGTQINGDYGDVPEITRLAGNGNGGNILEFTDATVEEILSKSPAGPDNIFGDPDYPIAYNPTYKKNMGPIKVTVVDPLNVVSSKFQLWMDSLKIVKLKKVVGDPIIKGDTASKLVAKWHLKDLNTGDVYDADTSILFDNEQLFTDLGISVRISQPYYPGPYNVGNNQDQSALFYILSDNNGYLSSSVEVEDSTQLWLSGVPDFDVPGSDLNWIRSGTYKVGDGGNTAFNDWNMTRDPNKPWDPEENYEKIYGGTWAPYALTAYGNNTPGENSSLESEVGPAFSALAKNGASLDKISSVDIVFTPDKSKWSRVPVLEMSFYEELAEGNAPRFALRAHPSVDKDGNYATIGDGPSENPNDANYISDHGMGWFPGYALNLETGERLNLMFGEDSWLVDDNGRDMLFNPTSRITKGSDGEMVFGGKHYVFVMRHDTVVTKIGPFNFTIQNPAYDAGRNAVETLDTLFNSTLFGVKHLFYTNIMYAGIPLSNPDADWLSTELKLKIRVSRPYERFYARIPLDTIYPGMDINDGYPMYEFSTEGLATTYDEPTVIDSHLDIINVVPNPYYAFSTYENNALDKRVKITNIPKKCTITIFDVSGVKIRQFKVDVGGVAPVKFGQDINKQDYMQETTSIEWDLNNFAGVPVSGGVYYIHVKSPVGERVIKWFCIQRTPDLNTF